MSFGSVSDCIIPLAKHLPSGVGSIYKTSTPAHVTRTSAAVGDSALFRQLPPLLLHNVAEPNANRLYGGSKESPVPGAGYKTGQFDKQHRVIIGAGIVGTGKLKMNAVLYEQADADEATPKTLVCHVYGSKIAQLEAELFTASDPSPLEKKWMGEGMAEHLCKLRVGTGMWLRSQHLDSMPGTLLTGDFHIVRPGPLPFLHIRAPATVFELEQLEQLVTALALQQNTKLSEPATAGKISRGSLDMKMVFDREHEVGLNGWNSSSDDDERKAHRARIQPLVSQILRKPLVYYIAAAVLACELQDAEDVYVHLQQAVDKMNLEPTDLRESTDFERAIAPNVISELTAMCAGLTTLERVCANSTVPFELHKLSSAVFAASDAALAVRDVQALSPTVDTLLHSIGKRMAEPNVMMIISLGGTGHDVHTIRLVNAVVEHEHVPWDEAARLIGRPWVIPVVRSKLNGIMLLQTTAVQRDVCNVTDTVRQVYGAAPAPPPKPVASPESVEQVRKDLTEKLEALTKVVAESNKRPAPSSAVTLPPPAPVVVTTLRSAVCDLEKLLRSKQQRTGPSR